MMSMINLLILQFIAHLLSDFTFQSDLWAEDKAIHGFRSKYLKWHILITFLFSLVFSFQWIFAGASLIIAISHWIIDGSKRSLEKRMHNYVFVTDQLIHLSIIMVCVLAFDSFFTIKPIFQFPLDTHMLLIIAGYLLCTKPANMIIREVLTSYKIKINHNEGLLNAGNLIGFCERMLTLSLILFGQFGAVGFIIAGKSILRYKEGDIARTEYVLIGTLLSFGIAIITGIGLLVLK